MPRGRTTSLLNSGPSVDYNSTSGLWERDWGEIHVFDAALQLHLVGDYRNGNIYQQSQNYYDFNGTPIHWRRRFPHLNGDQSGMLYDLVRLVMQTGVPGTLPAQRREA